MSLVLQISDPHFGTEQPPVVEALVRLVRDQAPILVVLSGDITQRARHWQSRAARFRRSLRRTGHARDTTLRESLPGVRRQPAAGVRIPPEGLDGPVSAIRLSRRSSIVSCPTSLRS